MRFAGVVCFLGILCVNVAGAQSVASKSEAEIKAEDQRAQELLRKQNFAAALPLYEDLHAQQPQNFRFTEGLAFALVAKASQQPEAEAKLTTARAKQILLQAQAAGDTSNVLATLLEGLDDKTPVDSANRPVSVGHEWLEKGEKAFTSGDLPGAVEFYTKAFEENPNYYAAALFAGDAEFKQDHFGAAGIWFAKAIAIDPNTETAHRYWGDSLEKAGEHQKARGQFIEAIIAEPYRRSVRVGLKQWADENHCMIVAPPIKLPGSSVTEGKDGHINLTIPMPADGKKDDPESTAQFAYALGAATWHGDKFKKTFPNEKIYRHSLAEEADSIRLMLTILKERKIPESKLSTSTKLLIELDKNGLLESWILLDNPDQGIAQDYVAYRKEHRDLLAKYILQYDVHEK
ncbi:MAG TPA: tetratricopeptide repeat protein [Acidobacteriaceae bacterium]